MHLADNATVRLDLDNEPRPDALLRLEPDKGGPQSLPMIPFDYIEGAPELIGEIAASRAACDLHIYRRNGVQEYLVGRSRTVGLTGSTGPQTATAHCRRIPPA